MPPSRTPTASFPRRQTAHDTFWDYISLTPESMHMIMWIMSDRTIPRSLRMMEGFGVHTFRLVSAAGESTFVKFHWRPKLGMASVVWDEALKINGADPDFHRRDLWEAIEAGDFPEWEFCLQTFTQEQADSFDFDVLDATKLVPEEIVPLRVVGRMVLDRNPTNFFAETEQVAYCTANVVPGSTSPTILCCRAATSPTSIPSSSAWAVPTSTRFRSTSRSARSTTCSATVTCRWACPPAR